ncbi:S5 DRBM domain-containing protein [Psidium guajava]|nr:S5 DRBM domain-containing protein [Psidium guajava]
MKTIDARETKKNKQRSQQNKNNQTSNSSEGFATYARGFIKIAEHRKRMPDELGIESIYTTTFERTFKKKDKTWSGDRAKAIKEKYDELLVTQISGGDGDAAFEPSVDNMALWVEASCKIKRRKIFGIGLLSWVYTAKATTTSSPNATILRRTRIEEQMTQESSQLKDLLVKMEEEIRAVKH